MSPRFAGILCTLLALTTFACNSAMKTPDIKQNPHPKMRYEITLKIQGAPGPFESVSGNMAYEVANEQCTPFDKFVGIYHRPPTQYLPITLERTNDHGYRGTIYLDVLQDEDYYGLGVCHWRLMNASIMLKAGKMVFTPYMDLDQIAAQQSAVQYFHKSDYSGDASKDGGSAARIPGTLAAEYLEQHPEKRFSITMSAKESFE